MAVAAGLVLSFVSALAVNWAYSREHDAANTLPPLSARRPIESARTRGLSIANWTARRTARGQNGQVGVENTRTRTSRSSWASAAFVASPSRLAPRETSMIDSTRLPNS